jgi:hypothetical protein
MKHIFKAPTNGDLMVVLWWFYSDFMGFYGDLMVI